MGKNRTVNKGDTTIIGGCLVLEKDAKVQGFPTLKKIVLTKNEKGEIVQGKGLMDNGESIAIEILSAKAEK